MLGTLREELQSLNSSSTELHLPYTYTYTVLAGFSYMIKTVPQYYV